MASLEVMKIMRHTACQQKKHACVIFGICSLRDDNGMTSKPTWKPKDTNSVLEYFEYVVKVDRYNFELYRFKVGAFVWDTV